MPFVRVVNYHEVLSEDFRNFKKQIRWLSKRYTIISFADFRSFLKHGGSFSKPGLLLTFDDALESNYSVLFPYLKMHGLHAVFFVPYGLLGKPGFMRTEHLKECVQSGLIEVGSHTINHKALKETLSDRETFFEVRESKKMLEETLSIKIDSFCWPIGDNDCYSVASFSAYLESGYEYGFSTFSEPVAVPSTCKDYLPRTNLQTYWSISEVAFQMSSYHDRRFFARKKAVIDSYIKAKRLLFR